MDANRACPAGDPCDLLRLLQGPHRVGYRLVMIPRSQRGWPAATIASLLGCDPRTVRRWVHRYHQTGAHGLGDLPGRADPAWAARSLASAFAGCWPNPEPGPSQAVAAARPARHAPAHPAPTGR